MRTDSVQRQQHRQNEGETQRVDVERHLLVQPDARHGHRAHVGQVRDRDIDGMAVARRIQADIGTRSVLRIDRDRRQLIVVRVAFVLQIHDHLQLAVGGLSGRGGVVELRGEVDAADGVVKASDLKVVRGRIERQRAFGSCRDAVDKVRPHLRVGHGREEGQVEAEHFNEHGD